MTDTSSDPTIDPSEREFGPSGISLSTYRFPTGWFIVGFASELAAGQVKRAHYFGEELVIFRTASGQINVLDAYCQHLGANMGVGGTVGGITGALIGLGIPEYEAKQYEGKVKNGNILISVHTDDSKQRQVAKEIFERAHAEDVSSTGEARV